MKSISLQNFQGHKESHLELHPGVNVIVGTSDSGKSSIIRALEWVRTNRPLGTEMIREVATVVKKKRSKKPVSDACEVIIECDRGIVGRSRKGKKNVYLCDHEEISASDRDVPVEVTNILGLQDINVQSQHDEVFLLSATSGEVARTLNKVANLEKIDTALRSADVHLRKLRKELDSVNRGVEKDTERLKAYEGLDDVAKGVNALEGLKKKIREQSRSCDALIGILERYDAATGAIEDTPDLSHLLPKLDQVDNIRTKIVDLQRDKRDMERMIDKYESAEQRFVTARDKLRELKKEFEENFPDVCPLCGMKQKGK